MRTMWLALAIAWGSGGFVSPLLAHHSVRGSHDSGKVVTITGTIARVDWTNPHVSIMLSVTKANGDVVTERVEIAAPGRLTKTGLNSNLLKFGDLVTIDVWLSKNAPRFVGGAPNGRLLVLPDGRRFDVGDVWPDQ